MTPINWKRESLIAAILVGFGLLALPILIYIVGIVVFGDYEGESGPASLYAAILTSAARGQPAAIVLVLSPWLVVQLARVVGLLHRKRKPVTHVTE